MYNSQPIFDKKNVLIIGGAGFMGSHLCEELVGDAKVICVDNFSSGFEYNIDHLLANPDFRFIRHDMSDPLDLDSLSELEPFRIKFQGVQEIYNLACPTAPTHFEQNRIANLLANSYVVKNALDLAIKYQAKFMHFSSSVVYGSRDSENNLVSEEDNGSVDMLSERASYDEGKRFSETMVKTYKDVYGLDCKIVRLFRAYGPRMPLDKGHLLPDFISNALDGKDLIVEGDADFCSSFCYVSDCLDAIIKFMETEHFGPINIGSDQDVNVTDLANKVIDKIGSNSKISYLKPHVFISPLKLPDIRRAKELLDWMPLVTLDNGLDKTIQELRVNKSTKRMGF